MTSKENTVPSFPGAEKIRSTNNAENSVNLLLSKVYPSPAADTQHKIFPTKLYPLIPSEMMEKKPRIVQQKHFQLEPLTGGRSEQATCTQQLQPASKVVNPLLKGTPSGLCVNPLDLSTFYGSSQPVTSTFPEHLWQLYNAAEKQKFQSLLVQRENTRRKLTADMFSSQGLNQFSPYMTQPSFPMSDMKFPQRGLNSPVYNLPQIPIPKPEAPIIPTQGFYDPTQAAEFSSNLGFKPLPNTFWPVPPNGELCGFRFFENAWWPVRKSVKPLPRRQNFYCRDCKTTFEATVLKKSNNGAVQHRCSFVGRPITRRVGIRSKVCKGSHPGACIIPLGELTEDEKAISSVNKEKLETVFCHNVEDLTYIKRYAQHPPLCRIRVWLLTESTKWGSKSVKYYDCQCNQLFPPVANIEVAKKHACQHDATKNRCDICGKWFTHHLQVNAHKKIHKVVQNKIGKHERTSCETPPCELERGSVGRKRQKIHNDGAIPKTEPTLTPSKPISLPPAMFCNPQFLLNNRLAMERQNQNAANTAIIRNAVVSGAVLPDLRIPNFDVKDAERSTQSRSS